MRIKVIPILALLICVQIELQAFALPTAKLTVKVVDDSGSPVEGARIGVGFFVGRIKKESSIVGVSNVEGKFTATADSYKTVGINVTKSGYYRYYVPFEFGKSNWFRWEPWNPEIVIVLDKIINPAPMYAKRLSVELPIIGEPVGFDLIMCDWVAPYGKGEIADFVFYLKRRFVSCEDFDSTLTVTFSNRYDGIIQIRKPLMYGSKLKLSRIAPESGYQHKLERFLKREPGKFFETDLHDDNNYFFRIRSDEKDGKLLKSMYGKIIGDITYSPINSKTATIIFTYYLNPNYTNNIEFDNNRNLFKDLKLPEQVIIDNH